jgi:hypothetical protein
MQWLTHLVTGADNETVDVARVLWIVGVIAFLCFSGYEVYKTGHFDMANFSLAYGGLLAAGAAGVRIKSTTEPSA